MRRTGTSIRLTLAALGTIALFGAATPAGIDRSAEMKESGITVEHRPTGIAPTATFAETERSTPLD